MLENESGTNAILNLGNQAVLTGQPQTACQLAAAIDSIQTSDVRSVSMHFPTLFNLKCMFSPIQINQFNYWVI